jgi:hypothetical protein
MRAMVNLVAATIVASAGLAVLTGCGTAGIGTRSHIAYIYATDPTNGNAYSAFFAAHGENVSLVKQSDLASANLGAYRLLLIDPDTSWTNTTATTLRATGARVLGLGEGGGRLFGTTPYGLDINYLYCASSTCQSVNVVEISYYAGIAGATPGGTLNIAASGPIPVEELYLPYTKSAATVATDAANSSYSVVSVQGNYVLWSFAGTPAALNADGQKLLWNVVKSLYD